jgi:calcium-binding protein CML
MWPALNYDASTLIYFLVFMLVGTIMVMPTIVAIIFDFYKHFHGLKVLEEKMIERRCLLMAFALVDEDNSGAISFAEFGKLCVAVQPRRTANELSLLFKLLDVDSSNTVAAAEFIRLSDVMLLNVKEDRKALSHRLPLLRWRLRALTPVVSSRAFQRLALLSVLAYVASLAVDAMPSLRDDIDARTLGTVEVVLVCAFALELVLKVLGLSVLAFLEDFWNRLDAVVILAAVLERLVRSTIEAQHGASSLTAMRAVRVLRVLRTLRTASLFSHSIKLRELARTFAQMRPVIGTILATIAMVGYLYLIAGLEAFHGRAVWSDAIAEQCGEWCPSFDSPLLGAVTLFQLVLASGSADLAYALDGKGGRLLTWAYVISFTLFTNAIMLSLLAALILEIFSVETERAGRRARSDKLAKLFPKEAIDRAGGDDGAVGSDRYVVRLTEGVRQAFEKYDTDLSGSISAAELRSLLADLGEELDAVAIARVFASLGAENAEEGAQIAFVDFLPWWQRYGVAKVFKRFDADLDGSISTAELGALTAAMGVPLAGAELQEAVRQLDRNGNGVISLEEYASWFDDLEVRRTFDTFDVDRSGSISRLELAAILGKLRIELTKEELREALNRLDRDRSGTISFAEFLPWWKVRWARVRALPLQPSVACARTNCKAALTCGTLPNPSLLRARPRPQEVSSKQEGGQQFTVQHNLSLKWEENLFLRRRKRSIGFMGMLNGEPPPPDADSELARSSIQQQIDRGALQQMLRQIASDVASGVPVTEDYLLARYSPAAGDARSTLGSPSPRKRASSGFRDDRSRTAVGSGLAAVEGSPPSAGEDESEVRMTQPRVPMVRNQSAGRALVLKTKRGDGGDSEAAVTAQRSLSKAPTRGSGSLLPSWLQDRILPQSRAALEDRGATAGSAAAPTGAPRADHGGGASSPRRADNAAYSAGAGAGGTGGSGCDRWR